MKTIRDWAKQTLVALQNAGADDAACSVSHTKTEEFNVDGGQFSLMRTLFDDGISLVAYKDQKKGSIRINKLEEDAIAQAVTDCMTSAQSGVADDANGVSDVPAHADFPEGGNVPDRERFFDRLVELTEDIRRDYPLILIEQMIAQHVSYEQVLVNTGDVELHTDGGEYAVELMFSAHDGDKSSSFCGCSCGFASLDKPLIELGDIRTMLDAVSRQIETKPVEGKFVGTVLLPPDAMRDFMSSLVGNFAGEGVLIEGTSQWKDKLNTKVADERITLSYNPSDPRLVGPQRYTADGYISRDFDLIKDGVLKQFRLSRYGAKKTGFDRAPNSSSNMVIRPGDKTVDELIAGIDRGLWVGRFSGGDPGTNGDFSGVAKNSFYIENGKIAGAVSETMISGNLAAMLNDLVGLSSEVSNDGSSLVPWGAFGGVTISGK